MSKSTCSADGCAKEHAARGYCVNHYAVKRRSGELPLLDPRSAEQRFWEKVDKSGGCWKWMAGRTKTGYGQFSLRPGRMVRAHRFAFKSHYGHLPKIVDHVCGNIICVNPSHLREATQKQNGEHRIGLRSDNSTGFRGVSRKRDKFEAVVVHHGVKYRLGVFDTAAEAGEAARLKRIELYTHNDLDRI